MQVTRSAAIQMFRDLGYKSKVAKWEDDRIVKKINNLPTILKGTPDLPESVINDKDHLANVICRKIEESNEKIELIDDEGETNMSKQMGTNIKANKKNKKNKKGKVMSIAEYEGREEPKKSKKLKEKGHGEKVTKRTSKAGINKYGYRIGTKSDSVDSVLSKKPKTMDQICEESKQNKSFVRMHLMHAVENDRGVQKTEKGFVSTV